MSIGSNEYIFENGSCVSGLHVKMYLLTILVILLALISRGSTNLTCFLSQTIPIENGWITKCGINCQISCNYGFITSGRNVFNCEEGYPMCVKTMAFIIGKF